MVSSISVLNDCDLADIFLERLRFFLRLSTNEDDALLKMLFSAAVNYAEEKLAIKIGKNESGNYPDALMITIFRHVFFYMKVVEFHQGLRPDMRRLKQKKFKLFISLLF